MARVMLLLESQALSDYRGSLLDEGHEVTVVEPERCGIQALLPLAPELIVVAAAAVTAEAIAECDEQGVRLLVIADGALEREAVIRLGLYEVADRGTPWAQLRTLLDWDAAANGSQSDSAAPLPAAEAGLRLPHAATAESSERSAASRAIPSSPRRLGPARSAGHPAADRAPVRPGSVIAVWGPAGAPGRSTLAVNLAAEFAELGLGTVLADADSYASSIAAMLALPDEAPGFAAACRLVDFGELNPAELQRVSQRSGRVPFQVLSGIGAPSRWTELSGKRVAAVLGACRGWQEVTVVDTGFSLEQDEELSTELHTPRRNAAALTAVRAAEQLVVVADAEPVGIARLLRSYGELLEQRDAETITVVVNRFRSGPIGMGARAQINRTLQRFGGIEHAVYLPYDRIACDAAILAGRALNEAARRSSLRHEIVSLARRLRQTASGASAVPAAEVQHGRSRFAGGRSGRGLGRRLGRSARAALS